MSLRFTVTEFIAAVNQALNSFDEVEVEGEVSEYKVVHGKWVVWQMKDESSNFGCFVPVWNMSGELEDGMKVRITGIPKLRDKGFFSFDVKSVIPIGEGNLLRAFQKLQRKLDEEGLFEVEKKRLIPKWPRQIVLITSQEAAAYSDFLKIAEARGWGLKISFFHTQVQGVPAAQQLIEALQMANERLVEAELIVLIRGGGSMEDLQAFNDERVVRAIAASKLPTVVGIGHERDVTLAELAADLRASTPSNAAELVVPARDEVLNLVGRVVDSLGEIVKSRLVSRKNQLNIWQRELSLKVEQRRERVVENLKQKERLLMSLDPEQVLKRGYSITSLQNGKIVRKSKDVKPDDIVRTRLKDGEFEAKVVK